MSIVSMSNAQALSKKAGVEFSIADISGDDLMSQRESLATQGVKVREHLPKKRMFSFGQLVHLFRTSKTTF